MTNGWMKIERMRKQYYKIGRVLEIEILYFDILPSHRHARAYDVWWQIRNWSKSQREFGRSYFYVLVEGVIIEVPVRTYKQDGLRYYDEIFY